MRLAGGVNPAVGLVHLLAQPFLLHAVLAGGAIGLASGLVGYLLVLRRQVFAGDAFGHIAFTGALAALAFGVDLRVGLYAGCLLFAALLAALARRSRADDALIGSAFAWTLGLGSFFLTLYTTGRSGGNGTAGVAVLFGSILGLSVGRAAAVAAVALAAAAVVLGMGRPLIFASVDPAVAAVGGVPVRAVEAAFLVAAGVAAGTGTEAVGALLVLGLLAAPAGAAVRLSHRPPVAMALAAAIATGAVWGGLAAGYAWPVVPPSFAIMAVATVAYAGAAGWRRWRG